MNWKFINYNLSPNETVLARSSKSLIGYLIAFIISFIFAFVAFSVPWIENLIIIPVIVIIFLIIALSMGSSQIAVTNKAIIACTGILYKRSMNAPLEHIVSFSIEHTIFGYDNISVYTAATYMKLKHVKNAREIKNVYDMALENKYKRYKASAMTDTFQARPIIDNTIQY